MHYKGKKVIFFLVCGSKCEHLLLLLLTVGKKANILFWLVLLMTSSILDIWIQCVCVFAAGNIIIIIYISVTAELEMVNNVQLLQLFCSPQHPLHSLPLSSLLFVSSLLSAPPGFQLVSPPTLSFCLCSPLSGISTPPCVAAGPTFSACRLPFSSSLYCLQSRCLPVGEDFGLQTRQ